jgi:hypothetical protein
VTYSSKMSVDFQQTAWYYIPKDRTLRNHCCGNLRSYVFLGVFKSAVGNRTSAGGITLLYIYVNVGYSVTKSV